MLKYAAAVAAIACVAATSAFADPEDIKFPKDYESKFTNYLSMDRANGKQAARLFANNKAVVGVQKNGEFPNGSILLMEVSKVKNGADGKPVKSSIGRFIRDGKAAIVVMQKIDGLDKDIPEELRNDNWEFAVFSPKGKFLKKDTNKCRECHAPLKAARHVFSYDHLEKANLSDYLVKVADAGSSNKEYAAADSGAAVNKILGAISVPGKAKPAAKKVEKADPRIVNKLLGSISTTPDKKVTKKQAADSYNKRRVNKIISSIDVSGGNKAAKNNGSDTAFSQNIAIKKVIQRQLTAFKQNKAKLAYAQASPQIQGSFGNSKNFMRSIRASYPSVYFSKKAIFPPMKAVKGKQHVQRVVLQKPDGKFVTALYLMVQIKGKWRIAGVDIKAGER